MKYIITLICLCSCILLSNSQTPTCTSTPDYFYRPMAKRTINFGDDVCFYKDISNDSNYAYVKPCEEGKSCNPLSITGTGNVGYEIHVCQETYNEKYDNEGETCETKDYLQGIDCTYGFSCNTDSKCLATCRSNQVYDRMNDKCIDNDPGFCYEYEYDDYGNKGIKNSYSEYGNKQCIQIELEKTKSTNKIYQVKKQLTNYIATIDDGNYIDDRYNSNIFYCKNGYALYFYGNGELKNPNTDNKFSEPMYLRCVTVLGKDKNGIIKYKIGENGDEKYYKPNVLSTNSLHYNDEHLMLRLEFFKNYKKRLESLNCRETGDCEDNELSKWSFFYDYPEYYYLYQNEPQVLEYLIQQKYKYKAKHTSPNGSSILNIKYLALLSLLILL